MQMERLGIGQRKLNVGKNERLASAGIGALLALIALRRSWGSLLVLGLGGYLVYRGVSGNCRVYEALNLDRTAKAPGGEPVTALDGAAHLERSITVNRTPAEVYLFWRNLENLPRFMEHLQSVTVTGEKSSHWVAKAPLASMPLEWDAEITDERPYELIAWGSLPGSTVINTGAVRFMPAPGNRGTEVHVALSYAPPGGPAGAALARLLNKIAAQTIKEDLRQFKEVMEAGEVPTTEGQPSGRSPAAPEASREAGRGPEPEVAPPARYVAPAQPESAARRRSHQDVVETASEDSFPASDPPSYVRGVD